MDTKKLQNEVNRKLKAGFGTANPETVRAKQQELTTKVMLAEVNAEIKQQQLKGRGKG